MSGLVLAKFFDEAGERGTFGRPMKFSSSFAAACLTIAALVPAHAALFNQGVADHAFCCGLDPMSAAAGLTAASPAGGGDFSASAPTAAPEAEKRSAPEVENGYLKLGFDRLASYTFIAPPFDPAADPKTPPVTGEEQIPAEVKGWSGKKAVVTGFMMPVKMEQGLVTEFLLVKDPQMCCYGQTPNMNEWIVVRMAKGVRPLMDIPISFYGELKVGAMFENGYMTGIYFLDGEKMGEVQG